MSISPDDVRRVAQLAHLELPGEGGLFDEQALQALAGDLERILDHVRDLQEVDVTGIPPTAHGVPLPSRWRDDTEGPTLAPERALEAAPARHEHAFSVPKVIE